jgi:hypothetical protein
MTTIKKIAKCCLMSLFKKIGGPWRHALVTIASAYRTEDPGFESRQGVRFLCIYIAVLKSNPGSTVL